MVFYQSRQKMFKFKILFALSFIGSLGAMAYPVASDYPLRYTKTELPRKFLSARYSYSEQLIEEFVKVAAGDPKAVKKRLAKIAMGLFENPQLALPFLIRKYGWFAGLFHLEDNYLPTQTEKDFLDSSYIEQLEKLYRTMYPSENDKESIWRTQNIWIRKPLTPTEQFFDDYIIKHIESIRKRQDIFFKLRKNKSLLLSDVQALIASHELSMNNDNSHQHIPLSLEETVHWSTKKTKSGKALISIDDWNARCYVPFPRPEKIKQELQIIPKILKNQETTVPQKAALLWYCLINIHPFAEDCYDLAYAVISTYLLKKGYPTIKPNHSQCRTLIYSCIEKSNYQPFVDFFVEEIRISEKSTSTKIYPPVE